MLAALRGDAQPGVSVQGRKIRLLDTARKSHVSIMDRPRGAPKAYRNSRALRGLEARLPCLASRGAIAVTLRALLAPP